MPIIKRECIEKIKNIVDIYDIISKYVQLKRSGANWKGLSPFTSEKTPSFYVVPEKKFFKCFSTGFAGDIFRFLELKENFSFTESVEWLAKYYNITIEYENNTQTQCSYSKTELLAIHDAATAYFQQHFWNSTDIQNYWTKKRQFSLESAKKYQIGYAPDRDSCLLTFLRQKNFSLEGLRQSGLFVFNQNESSHFKSRFEGRLIIPIKDVQGNTIGFSGRQLVKNEKSAKYINSPDSPIFHKGNVLFGLNYIRKDLTDNIVIVEGPLDAIRCWENNLSTAVAPQGTGITETQLHLIRRYVSKITALTDGDDAGIKCTLRIIELAFKAGLDVEILQLPPSEDPDSFLLQFGQCGICDLKKFPMVEFLLQYMLPNYNSSSPVEKSEFLKKYYDMIKEIDSQVTQEMYLEYISQLLNLDSRAICNDFYKYSKQFNLINKQPEQIKQSCTSTITVNDEKIRTVEHDLLSLILHNAQIGPKISSIWNDEWYVSQSLYGKLLLKVLGEIAENMWDGIDTESEIFSEKEINEMFSILAVDDEIEDPIMAANFCIKKLVNNHVKLSLEAITKEEIYYLNLPQSEQTSETLKSYQNEKISLRNMLNNIPTIE